MDFLKKVFFFFIIFFLLFSLTKNIFNYFGKIQFYQSFKNAYLKEKKENTNLKTQVLKNKDLNQTEKTIRNKLNLTKPDETTYVVNMPSPTPQSITPTPQPNWLQWFEVFIK